MTALERILSIQTSSIQTLEGFLVLQCNSFRKNSQHPNIQHPDIGRISSPPVYSFRKNSYYPDIGRISSPPVYSFRQNFQYPDIGRTSSSPMSQLQIELPASRHGKGFQLSSVLPAITEIMIRSMLMFCHDDDIYD